MKINGKIFSLMCISAANSLDNNKTFINNLNVFPVPDGDTGVNMSLTMSTIHALEDFNGSISDCSERIADMILGSARGNSGAILALFFRGFARALKGLDTADEKDFARAFDNGTKEAYRAVSNPSEGTILTIMRRCSEAAGEAVEKGMFANDLMSFFSMIVRIAQEALDDTPKQLPVLKEAGVVDAGGSGFVTVVNGMYEALSGRPVEALDTDSARGGSEPSYADFSEFDTDSIVFAYCTECIVEKDEAHKGDDSALSFREYLMEMGDSLVFAETERLIKIHVHTNNPGSVLENALTYGELISVKVENMRRQHSKLTDGAEASPAPAPTPSVTEPYGFVSVCAGKGVESVFRDLGVSQTVFGGQTMNPSTDDICRAINAVNAETVFVLTNNKNIRMVAEQAAQITEDKKVLVVPTKYFTQGLSAMLVFDPDSDAETNLSAMMEAAEAVNTISVTKSARDACIDGMKISEGSTICLLNGKIVTHGGDNVSCTAKLIPSLGERAGFISIYSGEGIDLIETERMEELFRDSYPDADIVTIKGDQPLYDFVISIEV